MQQFKSDFVSCCSWLADSINEAGEKGFGVVPVREGTRRSFFLQARSIDRKTLGSLEKVTALRHVSVAVSMQMCMSFCLHCGSRLEEVIASQNVAFDGLARAMEYLVDSA